MTMPVRPAYRLYQGLWACLDWLYPPRCGGCERIGVHWCATCQEQTRVITEAICERCGKPQNRRCVCTRCRADAPEFDALRSWAVFAGPVRNVLHRIKYKREVSLGVVMSRKLIELLTELHWQVDQVVPVPLGALRMAERGYNQAALLARPVAIGLGREYQPLLLQRARETASQVGLSYEERQINVAGAFKATRGVSGASIVVIDDVATSGATLNACAEALKRAGAARVYCLTLARAL